MVGRYDNTAATTTFVVAVLRRDQPGSLYPMTGQRRALFLNGLTRRLNRPGRCAWQTGLQAAGSAQQKDAVRKSSLQRTLWAPDLVACAAVY
jgi:hypothetical protein